ncbi:MAG: cation-translocating P-type ATPase [Limnochordia bacterium]
MSQSRGKKHAASKDTRDKGSLVFSFFSDEPPYGLGTEEVHRRLDATAEGLSDAEAARRLEKYGPNQLEEGETVSFFARIWTQIKEPLVLILLVAAILAGLLGEIFDATVIMAIVVVNALLGAIQESRAEASLQALQELTKPMARVIRQGREQALPAADLVPGDLIVLEAGSQVPADVRLVESSELRINEAALTGEAEPVHKQTDPLEGEPPLADRTNMAFMGTTAVAGRGRGLVVGTGMATELGKVAALLKHTPPPPTPLQKRLGQLSSYLGYAALALVAIVFGIGLWRGEPLYEMFVVSVSLAVAVIPEGLPAIATVTLALGVQKMQQQKAIIRKLPAVETLGTATVICSDKTGTLTQNKMTLCRMHVDGQEYALDQDEEVPLAGRFLLGYGVLVNDAQLPALGDPTELAFLHAAQRQGFDINDLRSTYPRVGEVPFSSKRKMMTTLHRWEGELPGGESPAYLALTKGAPDVVLARCSRFYRDGQIHDLTEEAREELATANAGLAEQAYRVLVVAYRPLDQPLEGDDLEQDLVFLGLVGLLDPPREEVKAAVDRCKRAGIRPVMITGDFPATALAIGRQVGLVEDECQVLTGPQLEEMDDDQLKEAVERVSVYARVSPHHKLRIVQALQAHGHVVAMTGDGINDAPALKTADIGAAMGQSGTDVAREAADLVLADDNFATIVAAVAQGRTIYANIRKAIHYLLSCNTGELTTIVFAIAFGLGRPLTAVQILWVNLVTDGLPALALSVEPEEAGTMERPPRPPQQGIFAEGLGERVLRHGILIGGSTLGAYNWALTNYSYPVAQTVAFMVLAFSQLVHSFNARSLHWSLFSRRLGSNPQLFLAVLISALLQLAVLTIPPLQTVFDVVPVPGQVWLVAILLSLLPLPLVELGKLLSSSFAQDQSK